MLTGAADGGGELRNAADGQPGPSGLRDAGSQQTCRHLVELQGSGEGHENEKFDENESYFTSRKRQCSPAAPHQAFEYRAERLKLPARLEFEGYIVDLL